MDLEGLKWLAQFGLGAVMAGVMFVIYRADRRSSEARFGALANEFRTIVQDNTAAITKLTDALEHERSAARR